MANVRGFEKLAISSTSVPLASIPQGAQSFYGYLESNDVRARSDDTDPTAATGQLIKADSEILIGGEELARIEFIRVSADATLQGHYYAEPVEVIAALKAGNTL